MKKRIIIFIFIGLFIIAIIFARLTGLVVTSINSCMDSDGGKDYLSKGKVEGVYYLLLKEEFSEQDYCENEKVLVEYYCVQEDMHAYRESMKYECELGCQDGRCVGGVVEIDEKPTPTYNSLVNRIVSKIKGFLRI